MSSRVKKMITLALNMQLQENITNFKSKNKSDRSEKDDDPEYLPSDMGNFDISSSDDENQVNVSETNVVKSVLTDILEKVTEQDTKEIKKMYTKNGNLRKRRFFEETLVERKKRKVEEKVALHNVKVPCNEKCRLKCPKTVDLERQTQINKTFWEMSNIEQRTFVFGCIKRCAKQRKTVASNSRRENSFKYILKDLNVRENHVCKTFLLATLGFHPANDRFLKSVRDTEPTAALPKKTCVDTILTILKLTKICLWNILKLFAQLFRTTEENMPPTASICQVIFQ